MKLKIGKFETEVSGILLFVAAMFADNMYANHCKQKTIEKLSEVSDPKKDK